MAVKTFTQGEQLTAADTNSYLGNGGLVYVTETTFTATPTVNVNNCFTSTYDQYRILFYAVGSSNTNACVFTLVSGGTERTTGYFGQVMSYDPTAGSVTWYAYSQTTRIPVGWLPNGGQEGCISFDIYNPAVATAKTALHGTHFGVSSGAYFTAGVCAGQYQTAAEAHQGFWFRNVAGTNMTGRVYVYGYRKA